MAGAQSDKNIHSGIWGGIRRFEDWLVGLRRGFGTGWDALRCFILVETRSKTTWIIPGLGFLAIVGWYLVLCMWSTTAIGGTYVGGALFRIFVFDYTIFFFGLVSGFNMARRWRANPAQVEELSLVPLSPAVVGGIFASGSVRIWWWFLIAFAIIETIICIPHMAELSNALRLQSDEFLIAFFHPAGWLTLLAILLCPWVLAWFHFESVRLAHWMFAAHALPRVPLVKAGLTNFIAMTGLVIGLSGLGSAITAMAVLLLGLAVAFLTLVLGQLHLGEEFYFGYTLWMLGSIAGAAMILWLKRVLSRQYETAFIRSWLLYQWWGAGESTQPDEYPLPMRRAVPYWNLYYRMREEEDAGVALNERIHARRYQQYTATLQPATVKTDPGGGVPVAGESHPPTVVPPGPQGESSPATSNKN